MTLRTAFSTCALAAATVAFASSCDRETFDDATATQSLVLDADADAERHGRRGHRGHRRGGPLGMLRRDYTPVWPVSLRFPDDATVEVASYAEGRDAFEAWREANPDVELTRENRPTLVFPVSLTDSAGATVVVEDEAGLRALVRSARAARGGDGRRGRRHRDGAERCFTLVYPVSVTLPDGTVETFDSKQAMRDHREANRPERGGRREGQRGGERPARPQIIFPVDVTLEDGTARTVADKAEWRELRKACRD